MKAKLKEPAQGVLFLHDATGKPRTKCSSCNRKVATRFCDYPLSGAREGHSCGRPICADCALEITDVAKLPRRVVSIALRIFRARYGRDNPGATLSANDTVDLCPAHAMITT